MSNKSVKMFALLGAITIAMIFVIQIFWITKAYYVHERIFTQSVQNVLYSLADKINHAPESTGNENQSVKQISSNYYLVGVNGSIDTNFLSQYLKQEFAQSRITANINYGIYDNHDTLVFGQMITSPKEESRQVTNHEKHFYGSYEIGVMFPDKKMWIANEMYLWIISTILIFVFICFFTYAVFIILRQKQLSALQKDFVNNMTHEFRTPISTIALSAQTLACNAQCSGSLEMETITKIIISEAQRLNNHVERILHMAHAGSSKIELVKEKVNVHSLIADLVTKQKVDVQKNLNITYRLDAIKPEVYADKCHLQNVLQNLLDNAIKYSVSHSEIQIITTFLNGHLSISMKDQGIGIDKKFHKYVGKPFFRVPHGDIHNTKGFGLGLNYVCKIAKVHHWKFNFSSQENAGSIFQLQIPN